MATPENLPNLGARSPAAQKAWKLLQMTAVAGVLTLVLAIALLATLPPKAKLSEGFWTPIVALEFAKTPADVGFLTGKDSLAIEMRSKVYRAQQIDMLFPYAYGGLLALTLLCLARAGVKSAWIGIVFALGVIGGEMWENLVIFDMLAALEREQPVLDLLARLHPATWSKWWCLAFSAGFIGFGGFSQKMPYMGTLGLLTFVALALTWFTDSRPLVAEIMGLITTVFVVFLAVRSIVMAKKAAKLR